MTSINNILNFIIFEKCNENIANTIQEVHLLSCRLLLRGESKSQIFKALKAIESKKQKRIQLIT